MVWGTLCNLLRQWSLSHGSYSPLNICLPSMSQYMDAIFNSCPVPLISSHHIPSWQWLGVHYLHVFILQSNLLLFNFYIHCFVLFFHFYYRNLHVNYYTKYNKRVTLYPTNYLFIPSSMSFSKSFLAPTLLTGSKLNSSVSVIFG